MRDWVFICEIARRQSYNQLRKRHEYQWNQLVQPVGQLRDTERQNHPSGPCN
jgi:hypothetical protein